MNLSEISDRDLHREQRRRNKLRKKRSRKAKGLGPRKKGLGVRIGDRDDALKAARGYTDPSTFVRKDGSEVLKGSDWRIRVGELAERSGGICEQMVENTCERTLYNGVYQVRCEHKAVDPQHRIKRSVRRDDRLSNLEHLCRFHHNLKHPEFRVRSGKAGA